MPNKKVHYFSMPKVILTHFIEFPPSTSHSRKKEI